jgi:chromosome segregation protein
MLQQADAARYASLTQRRSRAEIAAGLEENRLGDLELEMGRIHARVAELAADREGITGQLATAVSQEQALDAILGELLEASRDDRARLTAAETAARDARELLRTAETRARSAEVGAMEARLRFDAARESLLVELAGIGPLALAALQGDVEGGERDEGRVGARDDAAGGAPAPRSMEELGPALEAAVSSALDRWRVEPAQEAVSAARLASLRRRYHELGASNPFAAEEYAEIRDRVETLDAQRTDLETAIRNTRELIANVNALIADQFRRTFQLLEGAFARRFTQLFDGGEAQLSLTVPEDLSTTGVEITARPPGKKRQPLAMLSGGERTLTAVALLLAMLEVRPVPFCVLDEVDAALDEANIGRFSAALRELADTIQFVVITHNRGTIEVADALYGVTVDDDAVSRVISMRLADLPPDDARRATLAERDDLVPVGPAA